MKKQKRQAKALGASSNKVEVYEGSVAGSSQPPNVSVARQILWHAQSA